MFCWMKPKSGGAVVKKSALSIVKNTIPVECRRHSRKRHGYGILIKERTPTSYLRGTRCVVESRGGDRLNLLTSK